MKEYIYNEYSPYVNLEESSNTNTRLQIRF